MINGHPLNEQRIIDYKIQIQADAKLWTVYDAADMIATIDALRTRVADLERELEETKARNHGYCTFIESKLEQKQQQIQELERFKKEVEEGFGAGEAYSKRIQELEGDVESWHLRFALADADLDLTKEKVWKMETEIQQQQQTIQRLSDKQITLQFQRNEAAASFQNEKLLREKDKQTIERYEAALRYIAYEYYKHDHGYHFLAELAHDALTHKTGGENPHGDEQP